MSPSEDLPDPASQSPRARVLNEERRRAILEIINREGRVLVQDLGTRLETSQVTIRKDLEVLHSRGLVHRTHGGALPVRDGALLDPSLTEKERLHRKEKQRIAIAAASLVQDGHSIVLDSGSTTGLIARELRNHRRLTVITNSVRIAAELARTEVEVILTGGVLRRNSYSLVGPLAEESLKHLSADLLFLGVDGFDVHFGLTTPNMLEAQVNRVMIEVSRRTVVVCDSSKFGRRSLSLIASPSAVHHTITDIRIPKPDQEVLKDLGIEVTAV